MLFTKIDLLTDKPGSSGKEKIEQDSLKITERLDQYENKLKKIINEWFRGRKHRNSLGKVRRNNKKTTAMEQLEKKTKRTNINYVLELLTIEIKRDHECS